MKEIQPEKPAGLQTSNQTRITSVHMCLESVLRLEPALKLLCQDKDQPGFPEGLNKVDGKAAAAGKRPIVVELQDRTFWANLEALCQLLLPLTKVIMAVQSMRTTVADLARCDHVLFDC